MECARVVLFIQAEDGMRGIGVTGVQTCTLPIWGDQPTAESNVEVSTANRRPLRPSTRAIVRSTTADWPTSAARDRKSVVEGKSVDLGGRRLFKNNKSNIMSLAAHHQVTH